MIFSRAALNSGQHRGNHMGSLAIGSFIIAIIRLTVGKPKLVPGKGQIVVESVIGTLRSIVQPIVGKKA